MSSIKDRLQEPATPRAGLGRDLSHMRENGQASAAEIRDFLKSIKGKSPQEVLGVVAQSGLAMSIVYATIGCVVLLFVGSVLPYYFNGPAEAKPSTKAVANDNDDSSSDDEAPANPTAAAPAKTDEAPQTADAEKKVTDALGIGETKASDPKNNPLDGGFDKLLDGID